MQLSSTHCRAQEAFQRNRADTALLDNVRIVAERAAVAWAGEAIAAEHREAQRARTLAIAEIIALQTQRSDDEADWSFSENPDRGFA